ncbi:MAG: hypothetical protein VYE77_01015 [Planctomycetota bacterium]|nr:hypothetical protein [Planctomycetota bacterium]
MSRGLSYWTDERIAFLAQNFIAVGVPTWVARADGPEGEFLRAAGVDKQWVTSSGYKTCLSASGRNLGRAPSEEVLAKFEELPASEREPGRVVVPPLPADQQLILAPPEGGLVLRVHARFLSHEPDGSLRAAKTSDFPLMRDKPRVTGLWRLFLEPNTEHMWLRRDEWQALVPENPREGQRLAVDAAVLTRLARFHLNPRRATTSEGGIVRPASIQGRDAELIVARTGAGTTEMHLEGFIHWGSSYEETEATSPNGPLKMGFQTRLYGRLHFDHASNSFTRFDLLAPGYVWGRWGDANGTSMYVERPGRTPFGFALELAPGGSPTDRIPPGGNSRYVSRSHGYFPTKD